MDDLHTTKPVCTHVKFMGVQKLLHFVETLFHTCNVGLLCVPPLKISEKNSLEDMREWEEEREVGYLILEVCIVCYDLRLASET